MLKTRLTKWFYNLKGSELLGVQEKNDTPYILYKLYVVFSKPLDKSVIINELRRAMYSYTK